MAAADMKSCTSSSWAKTAILKSFLSIQSSTGWILEADGTISLTIWRNSKSTKVTNRTELHSLSLIVPLSLSLSYYPTLSFIFPLALPCSLFLSYCPSLSLLRNSRPRSILMLILWFALLHIILVVLMRSKELKISRFVPLMLILSWLSLADDSSYSHPHTLPITCTCCYDEIKGTQDQDFSCWFSHNSFSRGRKADSLNLQGFRSSSLIKQTIQIGP